MNRPEYGLTGPAPLAGGVRPRRQRSRFSEKPASPVSCGSLALNQTKDMDISVVQSLRWRWLGLLVGLQREFTAHSVTGIRTCTLITSWARCWDYSALRWRLLLVAGS